HLAGSNFGLTKIGAGTLELGGANQYTGTTLVSEGRVRVTDPSALCSTAAGTTLLAQSALDFRTPPGASANITVADATAQLSSSTGNNAWAGNILLISNVTVSVSSGSQLTLFGSISGAGFGLGFTGGGTLELAGTAANTHSGTTAVNEGTLRL